MAIKQLDRNGLQGVREFMVEVLTLSLANHSNLVKLIGYCAEGDQRLLVYEFMPLGSLDKHLHGTLFRSSFILLDIFESTFFERHMKMKYSRKNIDLNLIYVSKLSWNVLFWI